MNALKNYLLFLSMFLIMLTNIATFIAIPDEKSLNISLMIFWMVLSLFFLYPNRKAIRSYFTSERGKKVLRSVVLMVVILGVLGLINYLSFKHPVVKDWTKNQRNSLSLESNKLLQEVTSPLHFKIFLKRQDQNQVAPLLELYRHQNHQITYEIIDPELHPEVVQSYGITKYGALEVEYEKRRQKIFDHSELAISKAIKELIQQQKKRVYFVFGHGELDFTDNTRDGGSYLKMLLHEASYEMLPLDLKKEAKVPTDADLVLLWGPKEGFLKGELESLSEYVNQRHGKLIMAVDPNFNNFKLKSLFDFMHQFGLHLENDLVVDFKSQVSGYDGTVPLVSEYNQKHVITQDFKEQTYYPLALSLHLLPRGEWEKRWMIEVLFSTSDQPFSWGEKNFGEVVLKEIRFDAKTDLPGPIALCVAIEERKEAKELRPSKMVVFGNSTFVNNANSQYGPNFTLVLKAFSWALEEEFSLGITKVEEKKNAKFLSSQEMGLIFYFSFIFAPVVLLSCAGYLIYRRRRK